MEYDLTNQNISDTFQNLLQKTGSNNQLYDLKGNQIIDLTIAGALHAQSYIVSQSTTVATSVSTVFGDSTDDTHIFSGSVYLSGDTGNGQPIWLIDNAGNSGEFWHYRNDIKQTVLKFGQGGDGGVTMQMSYKLYTDKQEIFECKIHLEGA